MTERAYDDPVVRTLDRLCGPWGVFTFGVPFLIGYPTGVFRVTAGFEVPSGPG